MDTNDTGLVTEPQTVAGVSRARQRSSSSSSTSSSSSSSSSSSASKKTSKKRRRRHRRKKTKRARRSDSRMNKLVQDMGELQNIVSNFITSQSGNVETAFHDGASICSEVSGELYERHNVTDEQSFGDERSNRTRDFTFDLETKLKEPTVPKTPNSYLKMLLEVQRFDSTSWSEVRYADTQKTYNHTPGFIDLETNEEVKSYDTLRHLAHTERSYAAITYCILKQKETLQEGIRNLLSWAKQTDDVNSDNLSGKVEELFQKGDLHKVSSDLLQLVCGHRAETIEMRREAITSQVRDPLVKASLNRIPPSSSNIFKAESFTATLEKAGGVRKAFWPPKTDLQGKSNQLSSRPSRGQGARKPAVPSRGTHCCTLHEPGLPMHMHACNNPPSRGGYDHTSFQYKAQPSNNRYENQSYNGRGSFHNRGSRPDRGSNRGRSTAQRGSSKGHQKRYKQ